MCLQVEGVVAGRGLSLGHLMGVMQTFYKAIGIEKLKHVHTPTSLWVAALVQG